MRSPRLPVFLAAITGVVFACAGTDSTPEYDEWGIPSRLAENPRSTERPERHYLRDVVIPGRGDTFLIHWGKRKMPLEVYLPEPPPGLFEDPEAVLDTVREGILDWNDVVGPGIPRFTFVDNQGDADIPIVWAQEPDGDWYIAFCAYDINVAQMRMGVSHILVTGRWGDGRVASLEEIYLVVLHEMGHALGLLGHSRDPRDIMYPSISGGARGLSPADRLTLKKLYRHGSRRYSGRRGGG